MRVNAGIVIARVRKNLLGGLFLFLKKKDVICCLQGMRFILMLIMSTKRKRNTPILIRVSLLAI